MWNWFLGLKSLVCSESTYVLARLLIVQPDHTYANSPSWSQSIERITASFRHTDRLYTGPYNYWIEFGASVKESVSPSLLFTIDRPERADVLQHRRFWITFNKLFLLGGERRLPLHSKRVQLFSKYLIVWPHVFDTWRTSARGCF